MDPIRKALKGTIGCRVEMRVPNDAKARTAAKRLARIFESCGYPAQVMMETETRREGVHLESRSECAESALAIQSAFQSAGIDALLTVHERALRDTVILHIGLGAID